MEFAPPLSNGTVGTTTATNGRYVRLGNLEVDCAVYRVRVGARPVDLSYFEFELIRILAEQPDRVLPYDLIANSLWNASGRSETRRLQVLVHRLRAKLEGSDPYNIETVRGRGYGLVTMRP